LPFSLTGDRRNLPCLGCTMYPEPSFLKGDTVTKNSNDSSESLMSSSFAKECTNLVSPLQSVVPASLQISENDYRAPQNSAQPSDPSCDDSKEKISATSQNKVVLTTAPTTTTSKLSNSQMLTVSSFHATIQDVSQSDMKQPTLSLSSPSTSSSLPPLPLSSSSSSPSLPPTLFHRTQLNTTEQEYQNLFDTVSTEKFMEELNYPTDMEINSLYHLRNIIDNTLEREANQFESSDFSESDWEKRKWTEGTYINCDLRYYHLASLGKFDVVLVDPPWRIRGGEHSSDEKTMFNNSHFTLEYNTLSVEEIMDIDVGVLSDRGFIFLWTINSQLQAAFECLNKWGYTYLDRILWVKKTVNNNMHISQGYYFLHSSEICLVGVKKDSKGGYLEFIPKVSNDVIIAETRKKSQKPDQLYHIIERMFPGARKIELFGRNHNIRKTWLTLGNQLGEYYDWDHDVIQCDRCARVIKIGNKRYKSKTIPNKDICGNCFKESGENEEDYFKLENNIDEMVFHEYYECNGCKTRPLWGIRFTCLDCPDFDLCEACYDKKIVPEELKQIHTLSHRFKAVEFPQLAGGLTVHRYRCAGCETYPIIGPRFRCRNCQKTNFCQKCFFNKKEPRSHSYNHDFDLFLEPQGSHLWVRCDACGKKPIIGARYKCDFCFNYDLCEECYLNKVPTPPNYVSHKPTHTFTKLFGIEERNDDRERSTVFALRNEFPSSHQNGNHHSSYDSHYINNHADNNNNNNKLVIKLNLKAAEINLATLRQRK